MRPAPRSLLITVLLMLLMAACRPSEAAIQPTQPSELLPTQVLTPDAALPLTAPPTPVKSPTATREPVRTATQAAAPTATPSPSVPPARQSTAVPSPATGDYVLVEERSIGSYTVQLFQPVPGTGMYNHAIISAEGQTMARVDAVAAIVDPPVEDITGDGFPDVWFETRAGGGSHCCWGTVVYDLGPMPTKVLDIVSTPYIYGTGTGTFQDLDGDGTYEFITRDPITGIPCSGPSVKAVLRYVPGQGYVGAGPSFASAYSEDIAAHSRRAEEEVELSRDGYKCGVFEVIADYLYSGQADRAWQALQRFYLGADLLQFRTQFEQAIKEGRFYVGSHD